MRTLRNAVEHGQVHHAYLFVGSRGTGKTSMAKILASCLNCVNGPTIEPCGVCESCVTIAAATSMDVIEMDAASNNSVDDIRELRESVAYAPVSGRSKIYILDEAHMLSPQAWNAFLKTLEEPPPDTIFVLATTEAQKVLPTVVDRCHRFDFSRPTADQLAAVLRRVADQESIEIGPDAIALIARHATGSFRDALGTLEQLITYSGTAIAIDDVLAVLGVADADVLFGAVDAVIAGDPRAALLSAAQLADSGRDVGQFLRDLETHARELLVVQTLGMVPPEIAITPERDDRLAEQARRIGHGDVVRLLDLLAHAMSAVRDGADARTQLELGLTKAAAPATDPSTRALLARIERLEGALQGGTPAPAAAPPVAAGAPSPAALKPPANGTLSEPVTETPPPAAVPAPAPAGPVDLDGVRDLWPAVLDALRSDRPAVAAALDDAQLLDGPDGELLIAFATGDRFQRATAEKSANRQAIAETIRSVTGAAPTLRFESRDFEPAPGDGGGEDELLERLKQEFDAEEIS